MSELDVLLGPGAHAPVPVEPSDVAALAAAYEWPEPAPGRGTWVRANMVTTLDGATAGDDGRSGTVSSPVDREVFRVLRGLADVVLVGAGTARTEGYGPASVNHDLLPRRRERGSPDAAVVVQVTRSGRVESGRGLFEGPRPGLVVLADGDPEASARARDAAGPDQVLLAGHVDTGGVDLADALEQLSDRGFSRVLCEGGPALLGALAQADLLDELCLTTSPTLVAGDAARVVTGPAVDPRGYRLAGLLHEGSTLLARWVRER
ncbi:dihydrofolate reductase family protein [Aquipuribacter sp. MA13-6]|uniref:dihydrofolate reductase family protein n=1 Tax=unclassified Aquipuribacter TaxID=2635084 RepID=UPI003EEF1FF2